MTRPAKTSAPLARLFASDPQAAVVRVLKEAAGPLTPAEIKARFQAVGIAVDVTERVWSEVQKRIRSHDHVLVERGRYRFTEIARGVSSLEALALLTTGRPPAKRKAALVKIVRDALLQPVPIPSAPAASAEAGDGEEEARRRQEQIDAVRTLAELAMEVEELAVNEVSAAALVHRVRARVHRSGLEPIDRAGEETTYDRKRHKPIGSSISDGSPVVVVRPGYVWKGPAEDIMIAKATVEE